ncbi:MAG TPA: hypothetical protein VEH27_12870 [Methylomirabilota bacterium]|nr:hypothetical protein [Methylomirabilota bacterium]
MKQSIFDKLNLRPQERRIVVGVGVLVFVIINIMFVWPQFSQWGEVQNQMGRSQSTFDRYQKELANKPTYEKRLRSLEQEGSQVLTEELQLDRIIASQAASAGLILNQSQRVPRGIGANANQFFEEQAQNITYSGGPASLVNFLVKLASDNSMMRVRELRVQPDPSQTRFSGTMTIVASFQRKAPATPAPRALPAPAKAAAAPSGKSATNTSPAPGAAPKRQTPTNTK